MKWQMTWAVTGVLALAGAAIAQEATTPAPQQDQAAQQDQAGQQQRRVRPDRMGGQRFGRNLAQTLEPVLNLTPEQKTQVQEIDQKAREERRQAFQQGGQGNRPDRQKMREMQMELNKAAEAGDDTKVEQLQTELRSSGMMGQFRQQQAKTYEQVEQVLTPEQRMKFKEWRTLDEAGLPPNLVNSPDALQKAVMKLPNLSSLQKNQFDAIFERYNRDANSPAATAESKQAAALKVASDVVKELKPSQKVLLAAANRPPMGPGGNGRPGRQPRDVGGGAPAGGAATPNGTNGTPGAGQ